MSGLGVETMRLRIGHAVIHNGAASDRQSTLDGRAGTGRERWVYHHFAAVEAASQGYC